MSNNAISPVDFFSPAKQEAALALIACPGAEELTNLIDGHLKAWAREAGIECINADLIAGLPYENLESFRNSFNDSYLLMGEELQLGFLKMLSGCQITKEKDLYEFSKLKTIF